MDKLKLAHDWAMKSFLTDGFKDEAERADHAWQYADAMQAEAEQRNKAEAEQKHKEVREILNDANTFIEREGQHFEDVEEWKPDWSQAPAWANWWAIDMDLWQAHWYEVEPIADAITWRRRTRTCKQAPSFNYQGNWKDSLRKRPQ